MPFCNSARCVGLDAIAAAIDFLSLHESYPGCTGATEISGGAPPYARQAAAWDACVAGMTNLASPVTFNVPANQLVAWVGGWSAAAGGTFYGSSPLGATRAVPFCADAASDTITAFGHGLAIDQRVVFIDTQGAVLPGGITEGAVYWIVAATADTMQISTTMGGAVLNITSGGMGFLQDIYPEQLTLQGLVQVVDLDLNLLS